MRLLLVALALAGCLGSSAMAARDVHSATTEPAVSFSDCANLSGNFPVPAQAAAPYLPPGFSARRADATGEVVMWVVAVRCEGARVDGVEVGPAAMGYAELDVFPPVDLRQPGANDHTLPLFLVAEPPAVAEAFAALGLPRAYAGRVVEEALPAGGKLLTVASEDGSFQLLARPVPGTSLLVGGAWGMFGVHEGVVTSTLRGSSTGGGVVTSVLALTSAGDLPLLPYARPAARGGVVSGFDLAFERVA